MLVCWRLNAIRGTGDGTDDRGQTTASLALLIEHMYTIINSVPSSLQPYLA